MEVAYRRLFLYLCMDWYKDPQYVPCVITKLEEGEAVYALREAWKRIYGNYPTNKSLALLWSQWCLESGRGKFCRNYNFGNIKKRHSNATTKIEDDGSLFAMFENVGEIINGKQVIFQPPHLQTHFRAYKTVTDGAEDYIKFISQKKQYQKAWLAVIAGDPERFGHELKISGYYTASEQLYTKGIIRLTEEFMRKADKLLSWKPSEIKSEPTIEKMEQEGKNETVLPESKEEK